MIRVKKFLAFIGVLLALVVGVSWGLKLFKTSSAKIGNLTQVLTLDEEMSYQLQLEKIVADTKCSIIIDVFASEQPQQSYINQMINKSNFMSGSKFIVGVYTKNSGTLSYVTSATLENEEGMSSQVGITSQNLMNTLSSLASSVSGSTSTNKIEEFLKIDGEFMSLLFKIILPTYLGVFSIIVLFSGKKKKEIS